MATGIRELRAYIARYEHQLSIGSFFVGFALDTVILKRIDLLVSNAFLLSYLGVAIAVVLLLHRAASSPPTSDFFKRFYLYLPFVAQFAFGGMFSGFLIFYSQAGSVIASWPFLLIIVVLIAINEFMRTYQQRLTYQSLLLFFCFFSIAIYGVPILMGRMGDDVFELSGLAALAAFVLLTLLLWLIDVRRTWRALGGIVVGVLAVYGLITALYFSNTLPPIPLSLKDIGIYHSLLRTGANYTATTEVYPWYARLTGVTVSLTTGASAFAYSSVFAPTKLETQIVHRWQRYDETLSEWRTVSTIPFPIFGGRDGGYRGYSELVPYTEGLWRVRVETTRGQLIGQEVFTVERVSTTPPLTTRTLQ